MKLTFIGTKSEQPIISHLIKEFDVEVNIVHGSISQTAKGPYGTLIIQIDGADSKVEEALKHLDSLDIQTEVIEHA